MKLFNYSDLSKEAIQQLVQRNVDPGNEIRAVVEDILANVRQHGDRALYDYAIKFDKVTLSKLYLDRSRAGRDCRYSITGTKTGFRDRLQ